MAEPIPSDKCILILRPKDGSTHRAENYLRSRGWDVRVVLNVKEALTTISAADFFPGFAIIPVDHFEKNVTMLPGLLKQKFKTQIIAVFNRVPNNSATILEKFKTQYALTSPVSGPSIERIVSKMKMEGEAAASQASTDKGEKREKIESANRDSDSTRSDVARSDTLRSDSSRPDDKRNEKITIAGQKARKQEVQAPIQISRSAPLTFSTPKQSEKKVPLIFQAGNRGSLLRAVQEAPKPKRTKKQKKKRDSGLAYDIFDAWQEPTDDEDFDDQDDESEVLSEEEPDGGLSSDAADRGELDSRGSAAPASAAQPGLGQVKTHDGATTADATSASSARDANSAEPAPSSSQSSSSSAAANAAFGAGIGVGDAAAAAAAAASSSSGLSSGSGIFDSQIGAIFSSEHGRLPDPRDPKDSPEKRAEKLAALSIFEKAVMHGLRAALTDEDAVEFSDDVKNHCCLAIRSPFATGYLLFVQDGSYQSFGAVKFVARLRLELVEYMKAHGHRAESDSFADLRLMVVETNEWAQQEAANLSDGFRENTHVVIGFFASRDTEVQTTESERLDLRQISLNNFDGDAIVEFDLLLHLPVNGKYIRYTPPGGRFLSVQKSRLENRGVQHLFIKKEQIGSLTKYRAQNFLNDRIAVYLERLAKAGDKKLG